MEYFWVGGRRSDSSMEKERPSDKRKAHDKDGEDSSANDTSHAKNPTKRPRVGVLSPMKEEASVAGADQKNEIVKAGENGDLAGRKQDVISKKFDLPTPFTTQELKQKIGNKDPLECDDEDGATKFLTSIIQNEERKKAQKSNGSTSSPKSKRNGGSVMSQASQNSNSPIDMLTQNSQNPEVKVYLKICDVSTGAVILDETTFVSDYQRMDTFLRKHSLKLNMSSQYSSGYLADNSSSIDNSEKGLLNSRPSSRWTISSSSSLGSTIPRESMVSIATECSESPDEPKMSGKNTTSRSRKKNEPLLSSTRIHEDDNSEPSNPRGRLSLTKGLSNGSSEKSHQSPARMSSAKKGGASLRDEGIGSMTGTPSQSSSKTNTPRTGSKITKLNITATPGSSTASPNVAKSAGRKRRVGSATNFPITNAETPPAISAALSTPRPARSMAKIEGTAAKPLTRFELEMNDEPVDLKNLDLSDTLYTTILPDEPVFARWRDKYYYSGVVKSKGMNDTWKIDFDDGMEDVASESHIIPLRILGVGVKGIYSPDDSYKPKHAEIIGQKFKSDVESGETTALVKYAIKYDEQETGEKKLIWCSRRQLVIKEADAKKLRPELSASGVKPGDVSLDNIVSGPRRRTRGGESEGTAASNKQNPGAADVATPDNRDSAGNASSTQKARGSAKRTKKTPASEAKKKRTDNASVEPTETSPTPGPGRRIAETEANFSVTVEIGRKKNKKLLLQNMQFFLTAAGGGDPGISGPATELSPYDKDEFREQIESCGGTVLDQVGGENTENVFLISDGYARTVKYIYCLASGIPCVCHTWLKQCMDLCEIVDYTIFLLPAGWSLENQDLITNHRRKPLKGFKIFVTSESDQLYNYWKPVLTAAEAVLLKPSRKKGQLIPQGAQVVVTDNNSATTKLLLEEAEKINVPVVKPEWLVQSIIMGQMAEMYGHEKYRVELDELEETTEAEGTTEAEDSETPPNAILDQMESPD